jgi:probable rRNA maturation factor
MSVFLANEQADYRVDEPALTRLARLVMDAEGVEESEVSLLLVDRTVMTDLNERYMGEDRPTDVLRFPIDGPSPAVRARPRGRPGRAGSPPTARRRDDEDALDDEEDDDAPWLLGDIVSARRTRPSRPAATARAWPPSWSC